MEFQSKIIIYKGTSQNVLYVNLCKQSSASIYLIYDKYSLMEGRLDAVKPSRRGIVSDQAILENVKQSKVLVY